MSRELDLLKERIDYPLILRLLGIPFLDSPGEGALYFRCLNPEHEDRDPSMKVQYRTRGKAHAGRWRCWNKACSAWGRDIFDLVRVMRRCSMRDAVDFVAGNSESVSGSEILTALAVEDLDAQHVGLNPRTADKPFPVLLPEPHRPMDPTHYYFQERRSPPLNPRWAVEERAVYVTGGEYQGYMAVPLRWHNGDIISFQCFAVDDGAVERRAQIRPRSASKKLFPPRCPIDRLLYGLHRVRPQDVVGVVEGVYDTWRGWDAEVVHGTGVKVISPLSNQFTHGSNFGNDHATLLRMFAPPEIVVIPDTGPTGVKLVLDVGEAFAYACRVTVARLPDGHDPDSAGAAVVARAIRERVSYARWAIDRAAGRHDAPALRLSDLV